MQRGSKKLFLAQTHQPLNGQGIDSLLLLVNVFVHVVSVCLFVCVRCFFILFVLFACIDCLFILFLYCFVLLPPLDVTAAGAHTPCEVRGGHTPPLFIFLSVLLSCASSIRQLLNILFVYVLCTKDKVHSQHVLGGGILLTPFNLNISYGGRAHPSLGVIQVKYSCMGTRE